MEKEKLILSSQEKEYFRELLGYYLFKFKKLNDQLWDLFLAFDEFESEFNKDVELFDVFKDLIQDYLSDYIYIENFSFRLLALHDKLDDMRFFHDLMLKLDGFKGIEK